MKLVILDGFAINPGDISWDQFKDFGQVEIYDRTDWTQIEERIIDADAIFVNKLQMRREQFENAPKLKYIGVMAAGYNTIDLDAADDHGVVVTNVPIYGPRAVAQHAFALLLHITNHVALHNDMVKKGVWSKKPDWTFWNKPLIELEHKTIGIIGYGRIGQKVGEFAQAAGMKVLANKNQYDKNLESENVKLVNKEEIYKKADVISIHCPLTEDNKHFINKESISKMKDGVIIINNGRGPLIDEDALAEALLSGKVLAAGLDVMSKEPINEDNPLLKIENCYITPHISSAAYETRSRLIDLVCENFRKFLDGNPIHVVNNVSNS